MVTNHTKEQIVDALKIIAKEFIVRDEIVYYMPIGPGSIDLFEKLLKEELKKK